MHWPGLSQICKQIVEKTFIPLFLLQWIRIENHLLWVRWNNRLNPLKIWKRFRFKTNQQHKAALGMRNKYLTRLDQY